MFPIFGRIPSMPDPLQPVSCGAPESPVGQLLARETSRAAGQTSWRIGVASSVVLHASVIASVVAGQWWLAGWWELIVPPQQTNAIAAAESRLLEVAAYAPPAPATDAVLIAASPEILEPAPVEPVQPRAIELSPQGDLAVSPSVLSGEDLAMSPAPPRISAAAAPARHAPDTPERATDSPPPLPRQVTTQTAELSSQASAPSEAQQGVESSEPPRAVFSPAPLYPPALLAARVEGLVKLRVEVDAQGKVTSTRVVVSSGRPEFDSAAQTAVLRWRFTPAEMQPAAPRAMLVPVRFGIVVE
jgi:protein TonB